MKPQQIVRVACVDDDSGLLELTKEMLELAGSFEVHSFLSVKEAFQALNQEKYDVIISDYQMPQEDGLEFLKKLRAKGNTTPFIIFTGKGREEVAVKALNLGAFRYLNKNGDTEAVYSELVTCIQQASDQAYAQEKLEESEAKYRQLFSSMTNMFQVVELIYDKDDKPLDFCYHEVNSAFERLVGKSREQIVGKCAKEIVGNYEDYWLKVLDEVAKTGKPAHYENYGAALDKHYEIYAWKTPEKHVAIITTDITERKKAEQDKEIMVEFLQIANKSREARELVKDTVNFLRERSGYEAVGIRLKEGEDYPYYETKGFPAEHVLLENKLCKMDTAGAIIRDFKGNPVIECMCGNIICGRFDPSKKFFTEKGSFWTNNTTLLLANTTETDRQARTRNRCNGEGYESVALIPLHVGKNCLGLLQLNDTRKNMFTLETIQRWERIADHLALALSKITSEEALRKSEQRWATTLSSIGDAVIATDVEGKVTSMNAMAEMLTGWSLLEAKQRPLTEIFNIINEYSRKKVDNPVDKVLRDGVIVGLANHTILLSKDGKEIPIDDSGAPIKDKEGEITGVVLVFRDITERKKSEEALRESEVKFRTVANFTYDWEYWIAPDGRLLYISPSCERITGYSVEEFINNPLLLRRIVHPDDRDAVESHYDSINAGKVHTQDYRIITREGKVLWISHVCQSIFDDMDKWIGRRACNRDITERKRMEKELFNLAKFPSENPFAVLRIDKNGYVVYANAESQRLPKPIKLEIGERAPDLWLRYVTEALSSNCRLDFEEAIDEKFFLFKVAPIVSERYVNVYGTDITDRKKAEQALIKSEQRWATTLSSIGDAVIATDETGKIIFMNHVAEAVTGWSINEVIQKPVRGVFRIINEQTRLEVEDPVTKVLEKGQIVGLANHTVLVRKNGTEVPIDDSGAPIKTTEGKIIGVVLVFRDVTDRKRAESTLINSERKYRSLFTNMINGFAYCKMIFDKKDQPIDFVYLEVNDAFEKLTGLKKENIVGRKVTEAIPEIKKANSELFEIYGRVALSGKAEKFEIFFKPLERWLSISVFSPEKGYFVAIFDNITDRKKAEADLKEKSCLYQTVVDALPCVALLLRPSTREIVASNRAAVEVGAIPGKTCFATWGRREVPCPWCLAPDLWATGKTQHKEVEASEIVWDAYWVPVSKDMYMHYAFDITERKKTENALKNAKVQYELLFNSTSEGFAHYKAIYDEKGQLFDLLALEINPAGAELSGVKRGDQIGKTWRQVWSNVEDYWFEAYRKVDQTGNPLQIEQYSHITGKWYTVNINKIAQGQFAATFNDVTMRKEADEELKRIAKKETLLKEKLSVVGSLVRHDVRNKLTIINGNLQLSKKKLLPDSDAVKYLMRIESAINQTVEIFEFTSAYEKIGLEKSIYVNVGKAFSEAVSLFSDLRGVKIINECQDLVVLADSLLRVLFFNLIENSLRHSKKASTIRIYFSKDSQGKLELIYEDDGVGVDETNKSQLFTKGYSTAGGTGYGLYLIKKVLEFYGWTIQESGIFGKGIQFIVTIPEKNENKENCYLIQDTQ